MYEQALLFGRAKRVARGRPFSRACLSRLYFSRYPLKGQLARSLGVGLKPLYDKVNYNSCIRTLLFKASVTCTHLRPPSLLLPRGGGGRQVPFDAIEPWSPLGHLRTGHCSELWSDNLLGSLKVHAIHQRSSRLFLRKACSHDYSCQLTALGRLSLLWMHMLLSLIHIWRCRRRG